MRTRRLLTIAVLGALTAVLAASTALAAGGGDVAQNLADQLKHWAELITIPTAGLVALPALFRRDVGHAVVILVIVLIVGAFVFDAGGVQNMVQTVANGVLG